mgnify:CR=1 FL=1
MDVRGKATQIDLFSVSTPQMRAFHMAWLAFFSVFFAWFGIAPLMPVIREDLGLTQAQIGNTMIASVAATVLARVLIGPLCDRYGARSTYSLLLIVGSIPVMSIGFAQSYEAFLLFRLAIGCIGAAFVVTQYHTSTMFAPNCVGTANATTAGWGNAGGGFTQMLMPLLLAGFLLLGATEAAAWRYAMVVPGVVLLVMGVAYYLLTQDSPAGNYKILRNAGALPTASRGSGFDSFKAAASDMRVWALFVVYAACFGMELTINNVAALYFHDRFSLDLRTAGIVAGLFGMMNLFARSLGGYSSDWLGKRSGIVGRSRLLFLLILAEGLALVLFSRMTALPFAIVAMLLFSLFVQMASGATFGLVPFVNRDRLGAVAGIVGAGGNVGAVLAGFLFRSEGVPYEQVFLFLGVAVIMASGAMLVVRFAHAAERADEGVSPLPESAAAVLATTSG